jgi:hypothetical protein
MARAAHRDRPRRARRRRPAARHRPGSACLRARRDPRRNEHRSRPARRQHDHRPRPRRDAPAHPRRLIAELRRSNSRAAARKRASRRMATIICCSRIGGAPWSTPGPEVVLAPRLYERGSVVNPGVLRRDGAWLREGVARRHGCRRNSGRMGGSMARGWVGDGVERCPCLYGFIRLRGPGVIGARSGGACQKRTVKQSGEKWRLPERRA